MCPSSTLQLLDSAPFPILPLRWDESKARERLRITYLPLWTYKDTTKVLGRRGCEDVSDVPRAQHLEVQIVMDT